MRIYVSAGKLKPANGFNGRARWPLLALNFFMADMWSGIGLFVGVFLQSHGWASRLIGTAVRSVLCTGTANCKTRSCA